MEKLTERKPQTEQEWRQLYEDWVNEIESTLEHGEVVIQIMWGKITGVDPTPKYRNKRR